MSRIEFLRKFFDEQEIFVTQSIIEELDQSLQQFDQIKVSYSPIPVVYSNIECINFPYIQGDMVQQVTDVKWITSEIGYTYSLHN